MEPPAIYQQSDGFYTFRNQASSCEVDLKYKTFFIMQITF